MNGGTEYCDVEGCSGGHQPIEVVELDGRRLTMRCFAPLALAQAETLCAISSARYGDQDVEGGDEWQAYDLLLQVLERET